jgi:hypothetical protein
MNLVLEAAVPFQVLPSELGPLSTIVMLLPLMDMERVPLEAPTPGQAGTLVGMISIVPQIIRIAVFISLPLGY